MAQAYKPEDVAYIKTVRALEYGNLINEITAVISADDEKADDISYWETLEGNQIIPYDENYGITLDVALDDKILEANNYSADLIEAAFTNPIVDKTVESARWRYQNNRLMNNLTNRLIQGNNISDNKKWKADQYNDLVNYEDAIDLDNTNAVTALEAMTTPEEILAADIATIVEWNVWVPSPVDRPV